MDLWAWHQGKWYGETFAMLPNGVIVDVHRFAGAVALAYDGTPVRFVPLFILIQPGERDVPGYPQYVTDGEGHVIWDTLPERHISCARPTAWTTDQLIEVPPSQVAFDREGIHAFPIIGPICRQEPSLFPSNRADFLHR